MLLGWNRVASPRTGLTRTRPAAAPGGLSRGHPTDVGDDSPAGLGEKEPWLAAAPHAGQSLSGHWGHLRYWSRDGSSTLAQQGATVVLVGRNPERTAATVGRIQQETSNPHVECLMADLSAQAQVRQLAGEFPALCVWMSC